MAPVVELYFDPISPYAWLACKQLDRFRSLDVRFEFKPILFAALLDANAQPGPAEVPLKRAYIMRDVMRVAKRLGFGFEGPPTHPFNPLRPLRICTAVEAEEDRQKLALALMDAAWSAGLDITDDAVLTKLANDCGLNGPALLAQCASPEIKQKLAAATSAALAAGVFGVPTFRYENDLFWGGDRLDDLYWRLQGHSIDEPHLAKALARPASASRRSATR